jgi:putative nucleotidyltransferase with HDIG domain
MSTIPLPGRERATGGGIGRLVRQGLVSVPGQFHPVDLDGLVLDTVLDFNLYLAAGPDHYVLFRSHHREFTARHRTRLLDNGVHTLFIRGDERGQYTRYLEQHLDTLLASPEVPTPKKANLLYKVSRSVVQEAFTEPRSQTIVPRTKRLATETVDFVLRSDRAVGQLARIMSTDYYTYTHSINVCVFVVSLAHHAGVSRADVADLAVGALLHDLGKSQIPKDLLTRDGPLSEAEMEVMRSHVLTGERLLASHGGLTPTAMVAVSQHHEKLDGSGYPRALAGDGVHLFGRITAIADVFDAMTTNRSYQRAMTAFDALSRMKTVLEDKFDQELLRKFIMMLRSPV